MYMYGHLAVKYFNVNDKENAIMAFRKCASLAKEFDEMERVTIMHSRMFEGKIFDKYTLGRTYIASGQIKHLFTEKYPLSEDFKNTEEFQEILKILE